MCASKSNPPTLTLAARGGIRAGKLKVWIEVKRTLRAEIVE